MFKSLLFVGLLMSSSLGLATPKINIQSGIDRGGAVLGFDYSHPDTMTESYGVYSRLISKDEKRSAPGIFALGAFYRAEFRRGPYEFYLSPGVGMMNYDLVDTELLIGPSIAYGMSAELASNLAMGVENHKLYSWFGEYRGNIADTFLFHIQIRLL